MLESRDLRVIPQMKDSMPKPKDVGYIYFVHNKNSVNKNSKNQITFLFHRKDQTKASFKLVINLAFITFNRYIISWNRNK